MRILKSFLYGLLFIVLACSSAHAEISAATWHPTTVGGALVATVAFGFVGIALAIVGFKLFDAFTKFDLEKEICDNRNMAVAVLCAGLLIGICLIIAAAIVG